MDPFGLHERSVAAINLIMCTRIRIIIKKWARSDSNRGHPPCKGSVIAARPRARVFEKI